MNPNNPSAQNFVIPAQAGIQQKQTRREANKTAMLSRFCGMIFYQLDSGLRRNDGLTDCLE